MPGDRHRNLMTNHLGAARAGFELRVPDMGTQGAARIPPGPPEGDSPKSGRGGFLSVHDCGNAVRIDSRRILGGLAR
jgi:hypothetical protein